MVKTGKMIFNYKLNGVGWADGCLQINEQSLEFEVSYLGNPLEDLLRGLVKITPGYAATYVNDDRLENEISFVWDGEPWGYKWHLKFYSFENLHIQIEYLEDIFENRENGKICFDARCNYFDFVGSVIKELTVLLKKHGLVGYYETWAGHSDFPVVAFLKLKQLIKTKKAIETKIIEPDNPEHTNNFTRSTNLADELPLLSE
jgi:hypothetical protein